MNKRLSGILPPITKPFDFEGAIELEKFIENLERRSEFVLAGVSSLKEALNLTGFFGGKLRLLLLPVNSEQRSTLKGIFNAIGITEPAQSH